MHYLAKRDFQEALQLSAQGKNDEVIATLQKAVAEEVALPYDFGPPAIDKPSLELLGDQLLALGRAAEAEKAYREALDRTPGRTLTVEGLRKARLSGAARTGAS